MPTSHRQGETVNRRDRRGAGLMERLGLRRRPWREVAHRLYGAIVDQARQPEFYSHAGVPDSIDGRFDLIVLHAFIVLRRLKGAGPDARALGQELFDTMFADMDRSLREMGVADLGVGRRIKDMVRAFYGRIAAYDAAIAEGDDAIAEALRRNLFGGTVPDETDLSALVGYVRDATRAVGRGDIADLLAGKLRFGPPPGRVATAPRPVAGPEND